MFTNEHRNDKTNKMTKIEPWHEISNKFVILASVDSDEPLQPPLSLETPSGVQSVA